MRKPCSFREGHPRHLIMNLSQAPIASFPQVFEQLEGKHETIYLTQDHTNGVLYQGQRVLSCCVGKDLQQVVFIPAADSAFHYLALL